MMRFEIIVAAAIVAGGCGEDAPSASGGSEGATTTTNATSGGGVGGEGESGSSTGTGTGGGGGSVDATEACVTAIAIEAAVAAELNCPGEADPSFCDAAAESFEACPTVWAAFWQCKAEATTVDNCDCEGTLLCDVGCADELTEALACGGSDADPVGACEAWHQATTAVRSELGCPFGDDMNVCEAAAGNFQLCPEEWEAYFRCQAEGTTIESCECLDDDGSGGSGGSGVVSFACDLGCDAEAAAVTACEEI